jgi:nicotinamidase-related amidase
MPLTSLDPVTALVVIDLQRGVVGLPTAHPVQQVVANAALRRRRVTQLVLCGISTSAGVETTARAAFEHGYNVTLAVDAMTDSSADAHCNSVERIFPRLGETGTTAEVLARLPG